ncbi:MAG: bifunctional hydroxymethylpyrimidine kinase/phosphomethylpyrimidine kinase [Prevotella sp.]|jgi:hydroxymethylpyrimidine/phosphomethylpyrimidine kinase|nr:bifunctional hydroxymethylpyrimidine kinase/phosphomethylpyrimidine kinase [Prevotella sp.]MCH3993480.1 bifunctional hydroxymethylpyrimidine kinase/phosphomethylpyrimidine kinase [Prevotella sp.]
MFYITSLTIAGSDCSGGAGIQADIKTMSALGVYAASAITAVTVQNTQGVESVFAVDAETVKNQILAVCQDLNIKYAKVGMVYDKSTIQAILDALDVCPIPYIVVDPVMVATSGDRLMQEDALALFVKELVPKAYLLTPNIPEAEILAGMPIHNAQDIRKAAKKIAALHCPNILIKGGHLEGNEKTDVLFSFLDDGRCQEHAFKTSNVETKNTHGTGCTLSSAITSYLARGNELPQAVEQACHYVHQAIEAGSHVSIGHDHGPVDHFFEPHTLIKTFKP